MLGCCVFVFGAFLVCIGALFRLGASLGPEDDIDKAMETSSAYWLWGISVLFVIAGIALIERDQAADAPLGTDRTRYVPIPVEHIRRNRVGARARQNRHSGAVMRSILVLIATMVCACTSGGGSGLPTATPETFTDLSQIVQTAKDLAAESGDSDPRGVAIVKSSVAAVYDHASAVDPERNREMYFIRIDGDFTDCRWCNHQTGAAFGPTRWISFDWDSTQHMSLDFGYGSAPHLEEFGTIYAVDLTG